MPRWRSRTPHRRAEASDIVAHRDDTSGNIGPRNRMLGLGDPIAGKTDQIRGAGDEMGDTPVDAGGVHLDQRLRRRDLWPIDGARLQHLGRAVAVLDHRTHRLTLARGNDRCAQSSSRGVVREFTARRPREALCSLRTTRPMWWAADVADAGLGDETCFIWWRDDGHHIAWGGLMIALDWEQALATGHVVAAVSALLLGAAALLTAKGIHTRRVIGAAYGVALVLVNTAALSLHRENTFGVFHALAVASLVTISVDLSPLLLGRRSPPVIATHVYCMTWSYAGLVAAGCGQLIVAIGQGDGSWAVPVVIATVLSISGVVIFGRVP
jgi:uncharacterized membrane protein